MNVNDIIKKLNPVRRRKVQKRAAELIAEHKTQAELTRAKKAASWRPKYKLADLIAQVDPDHQLTEEDRQWLNAPDAGKEKPED
jgi:hypothetical protein